VVAAARGSHRWVVSEQRGSVVVGSSAAGEACGSCSGQRGLPRPMMSVDVGQG
ncbi:hypothetical protein Dimus_030387, partial [Dionaea muscipula]